MPGHGKTLVLSDLHLGNGGVYDIFAGGRELPALIDRFASADCSILINGDSVDFLMNEDPLLLDEPRAVAQAQQSAAAPDTQAVLQALGRVLAAGGDVLIRLGNHDIELALAGVQEVLRQALGQPADIAARLRFERGDSPAILQVGSTRVLVAHGEHCDAWNRVDYLHLPGPGGAPASAASDFEYAPGSRLVKTLMNPLKRAWGLRLIDLIKPDFQGGVLTALAVNMQAVKEAFKGSTLQILRELNKQSRAANTFADDEEGDELGLQAAFDGAGLDEDERELLAGVLRPADGKLGGHSFDFDFSILQSAQLKLVRAGLRLYSAAHRHLVGQNGERFYSLQPEPDEWSEAQRMGKKYNVDAVIFGHTHAARWQVSDGLTYINTGTWIRILYLPSSDAPDESWQEFLELARQNPELDPNKGKMVPLNTRFTAAVLEAESATGGAKLSLIEWRDGEMITLGSQVLRNEAAR